MHFHHRSVAKHKPMSGNYMRKIIVLNSLVPLFCAVSFVSIAQEKVAGATKANGAQNIEAGIDEMFKAMDRDGNKQLSYNEFKMAVVNERKQVLIIERLRADFTQLDKNRSKSLDAAEFNAHPGIKTLSEPKPKLSQFDRNSDQNLDFAEYVGFIQQMNKSKVPVK
jgi:Ca2+-binding EF-hand superfamily protein